MFDVKNFELNSEQLVEVFEEKSTLELSNQWLHLKQQEEQAYQQRILIEKELFARLEHHERTGARTYDVGNHHYVTIKRENSWGIRDAQQLEILFSQQATVPFTKRLSISDAKMRQLAEQAPSLYKKACAYLIVKPAKPNFMITFKGRNNDGI